MINQKNHQSSRTHLMEYLIEMFKPDDKTQQTLQWLRDKKGYSKIVTHSNNKQVFSFSGKL